MESLLRKKGLRVTKQRLLIINALKKHGPSLVRDLAASLRRNKIDQATLYRSLVALEKVGLVRRVDMRPGGAGYELNDEADHHHHHLICIECGRIEDIDGCDIERLKSKALKGSKHFNAVVSHSIELYGLCRACAAKRK